MKTTVRAALMATTGLFLGAAASAAPAMTTRCCWIRCCYRVDWPHSNPAVNWTP